MSIEDGLNKLDKTEQIGNATPRLRTNKKTDPFHQKTHSSETFEVNNSFAEETRSEIVEHYNIPLVHVITVPAQKGSKRVLRAFTLLQHRTDQQKKYYADGHMAHAVLLNIILDKYKDEIGAADREDVIADKNFFDYWQTKKGFIDPYADNFNNYPEIRSGLAQVMSAKGQNGLSESEVEEFKKHPESKKIKIPNWFLSD